MPSGTGAWTRTGNFSGRTRRGRSVADFDDSDWRTLDVPHDWSIEDLPPAGKAIASFAVVEGKWRFHKGDDPAWENPVLNDSEWQEVQLPDNWKHHSNYAQDNAYGWFRRHIPLPAVRRGQRGGIAAGQDSMTWTKPISTATRIGGMGSFPPNFQTASRPGAPLSRPGPRGARRWHRCRRRPRF